MYRIDFDEERRLVSATLDGFWTPDTVAAYEADLFTLFRRVGAPDAFVRMIARCEAMPVQSPETSAAFGKFTLEIVEHCRGPIAITAGSTLNKMQAQRVLSHERIRVFVDEPEALDWLMSWPAE